jgi:hypothetical protein
MMTTFASNLEFTRSEYPLPMSVKMTMSGLPMDISSMVSSRSSSTILVLNRAPARASTLAIMPAEDNPSASLCETAAKLESD